MELKEFTDIFRLDRNQQEKIIKHFASPGLVDLPLILSGLKSQSVLRKKIVELISENMRPTILEHEQNLRDNPTFNREASIETCKLNILSFARAIV